jgi:hypothetical protein
MTTIAVWIGTLILYLPASHGLYVSADSRHDGGDPAQADEARKIFLCGPEAVCAISGALRLTVTRPSGEKATLDVVQLLDDLSRDLPAEATAQNVARLLDEKIAAFWNEHLTKPVGSRLSARTLAPSLCTVLFVRRGALAQIQFPFREQFKEGVGWNHERLTPVIIESDPARPLAQGKTECMGIRPDQPPLIETREETLATIRVLYRRTESDDYCRAIIGGPIDIAVIDDGGSRWLARKGPAGVAQ